MRLLSSFWMTFRGDQRSSRWWRTLRTLACLSIPQVALSIRSSAWAPPILSHQLAGCPAFQSGVLWLLLMTARSALRPKTWDGLDAWRRTKRWVVVYILTSSVGSWSGCVCEVSFFSCNTSSYLTSICATGFCLTSVSSSYAFAKTSASNYLSVCLSLFSYSISSRFYSICTLYTFLSFFYCIISL